MLRFVKEGVYQRKKSDAHLDLREIKKERVALRLEAGQRSRSNKLNGFTHASRGGNGDALQHAIRALSKKAIRIRFTRRFHLSLHNRRKQSDRLTP
jgi:hypothetical protein